MTDEPETPEATINRLLGEVCRLSFELGKAHGELEGLRAGWSVSNHEAWQQGHDARPGAENPFPPCCWKCTPRYSGMMLCSMCGNKRCPHANDHALACTRSNEPGQPGSAYPVQD